MFMHDSQKAITDKNINKMKYLNASKTIILIILIISIHLLVVDVSSKSFFKWQKYFSTLNYMKKESKFLSNILNIKVFSKSKFMTNSG
jgi:hypothetical protein